MRTYVHGADGVGRDAWPHATSEGAVFAELNVMEGVETCAETIAALVPLGGTVIAHSWGAVPTVLALGQGRISPDRLVLIEPSLYDVGRGTPQVEAHIDQMTSARANAAGGDLLGFWQIARPLLLGEPAEQASWEAEQGVAGVIAVIPAPWGHGLTANMISTVPTLVITGGWNDEYEVIATKLAAAGAIHRQLEGFQHRPQDHPGFEALLDEFLG